MKVFFSASIISFFENPFRGRASVFLFSIFAFNLCYSNPTTCDSIKICTKVNWEFFNRLYGFGGSQNLVDVVKIKGFQHYEFPRRESFFLATKGNIGHPSRPLQFSPRFSAGYTLLGFEPHFGNRFDKETIRFYNPEHIFADLFYTSGPKREQTFDVLFNQRFSQAMVVGFNYRSLNSPGRYSRSAASNTTWYANFNYNNPLKIYGAAGGLIVNRVQNQESGGLKDRLAFEANDWSDGGILSKAELKDFETTFFMHQFLKTGKVDLGASRDSIVVNEVFIGRVFHDFSFSGRSINFYDSNSPEMSFFGSQPISNQKTHDSTMVFMVDNSLGVIGKLKLGSRNTLKYKSYAKHRYARITQNVFDTIYGPSDKPINVYDFVRTSLWQIIAGGQVEMNLGERRRIEANGSYVALGRGFGDLSLKSKFVYGLPENSSEIQLTTGLLLQETSFFLSNFFGNYVSWQNNFKKQRVAKLGLGLRGRALGFDFNAFWLKDMVYLGPDAKPTQNTDGFGLVSLRGGLKKSFGPIHTSHDILLQFAGTDNFERFPALISYHTLFVEFSLFREAMFLNLGIDVFYNSPYKPMGFMPVVRHFFTQNGYKSDHIVSADIFGTFRVDRARFFLKAQNVGSHIPGMPVVYQVPFYPLQDFAVKFGVSWLFFD